MNRLCETTTTIALSKCNAAAFLTPPRPINKNFKKGLTYLGGGISVEYNSTLRSASKMAFIPRAHISASQIRHLSS